MTADVAEGDATGALGPLAGVIVFCEPARFEALRDFYRDTLGLPARSQRPGFVSFEWGELRLSLTGHSDLDGASRDPLRIMLNFLVADIVAAHRRLQAAGVEFVRPPEREHFGGWFATFRDPDGNLLQLMQLP